MVFTNNLCTALCLEQPEGKEVDRVPHGQYGVQILAFPGLFMDCRRNEKRVDCGGGRGCDGERRRKGNIAGRLFLPDLFDKAASTTEFSELGIENRE